MKRLGTSTWVMEFLRMQVGMFQVLLLQRTPERAYKVLQPLEPFRPFPGPLHGHLPVRPHRLSLPLCEFYQCPHSWQS